MGNNTLLVPRLHSDTQALKVTDAFIGVLDMRPPLFTLLKSLNRIGIIKNFIIAMYATRKVW